MRPTIPSKRQANLRLLAYLFIIFGLATLGQPRSLSVSEAWWLWVVRDETSVKFTSPGQTARTVIGNFRTTLDRAQENSNWDVPYAVVLDGWSTLVGDSSEMGRVLSAFLTMLALAILWRGLRLWSGLFIVIAFFAAQQVGMLSTGLLLAALVIGLIVRLLRRSSRSARIVIGTLAVIVLLFAHSIVFLIIFSQTDSWDTTVQHYLDARHPLEPVIINYAPSSVAGYYDYRYNLRRGVAVDLSWKSFDDAEITTIIDRLIQGGYPVWLVMPSISALPTLTLMIDDTSQQAFTLTSKLTAALEALGWQRDTTYQVGGMVFSRYERVTMGDVP